MKEHATVLAIFVAVIMLGSCLSGCGGPPKVVQTALDVTAHELVVVDQDMASRYTAAAESALDASTTISEYHHRMERWDRVETAFRTSSVALLAAQRAVDAWDNSKAGARASLGCLADAIQILADALVGAGVPIPSKLLQVLSLGEAFVGHCQEATP